MIHRPACRALVVGGHELVQDLLRRLLREEGFPVTVTAAPGPARGPITAGEADLLVVDVGHGDQEALGLLDLAAAGEHPMAAVALISANGSDAEVAVQALRHGAFACLRKPFDGEELLLTCRGAVRQLALLRREAAAPPLTPPAAGPGAAPG